ncbi:putative Osmotin precursor [Tripterygium wilfordii]|uniref:Putative Osmotin n=1 Tax=Tripterygium wilfordii TaxID=458696 RepID=A0A7J7CLA5_TRIWF|nr:thaumatin-like protein 1 [Tripterygium wilfordii]KAF5734828.1 putative Osmotin precursor [Tripterygium wilfordii]
MSCFLKALPIFTSLFFISALGAFFDLTNNCPYTVWAACQCNLPADVGCGKRLDTGEKWTIICNAATQGSIWGRTNCQFNASGKGSCQTGDCNGMLECQGYGKSPNTLAEFSLKQLNGKDYFDISVVDGFNVPMEFSAVRGGPCTIVTKCNADIIGQCPNELKVPGGCNGPCPVFGTEEYCCTSGSSCGPTNLSMFFKARCPDAYTYPFDDPSNFFTCASGTNYKVIFCPA